MIGCHLLSPTYFMTAMNACFAQHVVDKHKHLDELLSLDSLLFVPLLLIVTIEDFSFCTNTSGSEKRDR